jgi:SAM-dependent methyltransferase
LSKAVDLSGIQRELEANSNRISTASIQGGEKYSERLLIIAQQHLASIKDANNDLLQVLAVIDDINNEITELTRKFFTASYQTECQFIDPTDIRHYRILYLAEGSELLLRERINLYSSWKYPALEIGCRDGEWTKHLVASDPLYIADISSDFIETTTQQFTPEYQARLRRYLIDITDYKIANLPTGQFNFIFSFNFFNYLSLDSIKQLLKRAMIWLRPGGVMLFTYNNCDMSPSAGLSEGYFMTYVPKSLLIPLVESLGYEVVTSRDFEPSTSWIEIKKPGTLSTVKAHQALGEIKYR